MTSYFPHAGKNTDIGVPLAASMQLSWQLELARQIMIARHQSSRGLGGPLTEAKLCLDMAEALMTEGEARGHRKALPMLEGW